MKFFLLALLVPAAWLGGACQRSLSPLKQPEAAPLTVLMRGTMCCSNDTTALKGFEAVFMRTLNAPEQEQIVAAGMAETGRYHVRLLAGQLYYIKLYFKPRNCLVETQEFAVPPGPIDTALTKDFGMYYPDSTDYGGCMAGWHR